MNIIKFNDIIADQSLIDADFFNENLRGKYAYWVHCKYVITLDSMDVNEVVELEKSSDEDIIDELLSESIKYVDLYEGGGHWIYTEGYIDWTKTNKINSVDKYITYNSYVPDDDITLEELKKFRTWLATNLLLFDDWDDNEIHMLEYYKNGMTDDTIKWLTEFGNTEYNIINTNTVSQSSCGCNSGSNLSSLYNETLFNCDPLSVYKSNIKLAMVKLFSDIDTWVGDDKVTFLEEIVKYLKGIIKANLPLVYTTSTLDIYSCKCLSDANYPQKQAQLILEDLINAFEWIINDDIKGHKNNIINSLMSWSSNLYEIMEWD